MKINGLLQFLNKFQEQSLKHKSIRSGLWGFLGKGSEQFLRFINNLILTRLLFPEAFGLMAIANSTLMMVNLFSDTGVKTAIIQNPNGSNPEFLNTAWIISICRGFLLCLVVIAITWPLSKFYNKPELTGILLIMSLNPAIGGFENPSLSLLVKSFKVKQLAVFEFINQIVSFIILAVLAFVLRSVNALVIGSVIVTLIRTICSYFVVKPFPKFSWDSKAGAMIFGFGKFIFFNTMITWAALNIDIIIIGRLLGMESLAFYNIGKNFAFLPIIFLLQIIAQAYFPAVSSISHDLQYVMRIFKKTSVFFLTLCIPIGVCFAIFSHDIIRLLYDSRYETSYISMYWLSACIIFRVIGAINGTTLIATGHPFYETVSNFIGLIITLILLFIGIKVGDLTGAAIGMSLALSITPLIESYFLIRIIKFPYSLVLKPWIQAIACSAAIIAFSMVIKLQFSNERLLNIPFIIVTAISSVIISIIFYAILEKKRLRLPDLLEV
jgi:O-antigen/teichoic acid export membrane protein